MSGRVFRVDPYQLDAPRTGIYVRAVCDGHWGSYDISMLDAPSLLAYLREPMVAEAIVFQLLGRHYDLEDARAALEAEVAS